MAKIFVRERRKVEEGEKKPRYRVAATTGTDLRIRCKHLRKVELNVIAEAVGAEIVYLPVDGGGKGGGKGGK